LQAKASILRKELIFHVSLYLATQPWMNQTTLLCLKDLSMSAPCNQGMEAAAQAERSTPCNGG
jgi:hypothetical protein